MKAWAQNFQQDKQGAVAILFALVSIMLFGAVAIAIDSSRAYSLATRVAKAQDAAALAAAKWMAEHVDATDADIKKVATDYFNAHMAEKLDWGYTINKFKIIPDRDSDTVTVNVEWEIENSVAGVVGMDSFDASASTSASYGLKEVEPGLMLDVSGSMNDDGKLDALKTAATELTNVLLPDSGRGVGKTRIGLAPYSTSINAGAYASKSKGNGNGNGNGNKQEKCVSERKGADAFTDQPPKNGKFFGGKPVDCPDNEVLALSQDKTTLNDTIDAYTAFGSTAGHLGIGWAWYLVSPEWKDMWPTDSEPKPYGDEEVVKAIVVMTDGMFNTEYEPDNGDSAAQALALCNNIKDSKVQVFTVAFDAPATVLPLLKDCASSEDHFFDASSAADLKAAFKDIADDLTAIRLKD
jgi:Putative Flp pilus-assembly TadE/G-like